MSTRIVTTHEPMTVRCKWRLVSALALILLGLAMVILLAGEESFVRQDIRFEHDGNQLQGVLVMPRGDTAPRACMVFVHGSGDIPRDAYGYYAPLWRLFARQGWCSLAWDKPGVGDSSGDWRHQSMADRAAEVSAAIDFLRESRGLGKGPVGLIGFSQAGWVLPKVANQRDDVAFVISVSGAVNWMAQSRYSGRQRRLAEGLDAAQIAIEEAASARVDTLIQSGAPYSEYLALVAGEPDQEPMSEAFWGFAQRNWSADVRDDLRRLRVPMLALFGSHDAYVDPVASSEAYRQALARSQAPFFEIAIIDGADHSLMPTNEVKPAHEGMAAWWLLLKIWFGGDDLYADGMKARLEQWLGRFPEPPADTMARGESR